MLSDIRAYDRAKAKAEESFPAELVYRITLAGENPIAVLREFRGLTQKQLAEAVGDISSNYLSEIEAGVTICPISILKVIAEVLEVDLDMVINFTQPPD